MASILIMPKTLDKLYEEYGFRDSKEVYTNGSELIQMYRVKQWFELNRYDEAIEKQIPKKPRKAETIYGVDGCGETTNKLVLYTCPVCDEPIHVGRGCSNNDCLQRIDWSEEE